MFGCYNNLTKLQRRLFMASTPQNFSYDGTFEGLLCVIVKCISLRVMPRNIKPDYMVVNTIHENTYLRVRSDYTIANKLYQLIGRASSAENQQMASDCFLTCMSDMEKELFLLVCKSLKYGAYIAEEHKDETMARIQVAIRNLYREEQAYFAGLDLTDTEEVSVAVINPVNCILPIMKYDLSRKYRDRNLLIYDKRHRKVFVKKKYTEDVFDVRMIQCTEINNTEDVLKYIWPYFSEEIRIRDRGDYKADSLTKLWYIAG